MLYDVLHFFSPLAQPIGIIWLLALFGTLVCLRKRQRVGAAFLAMLAILISLIGSRIPLHLLTTLEQPYLRKDFSRIPECDAVVMLGGTHETSLSDLMGFNWHEASDRILTALELVRRKKGQELVFGGGTARYDGKVEPVSKSVEKWIAAWELTTAPVIVMEGSLNTREEALKVKKLAEERGWKKVILVTSAYHMKRAEAVFRQVGVPVEPVACDFTRLGTPYTGFNIFPRPEEFGYLDLYLHEKIGWWVYRWRGWIGDQAAKK